MFRLNSKGQLAGWEALIIFILLGCCLGLGYLYANKKTEANIYTGHSKPEVFDMKPSPFSCVRIGIAEEWGRDAISNTQAKH